MAFTDYAFYVDGGDGVGAGGWWDVPAWQASHAYVCGDTVRQLVIPGERSERVFLCKSSTSGTGQSGSTEPGWSTTRGASFTDNTVAWTECTGNPGLCGDLANTPDWNAVKGTSVSAGQVIKSNDGAKLLLCTTAGTAGSGSEPSWAAYTAAGATTADNTTTWTTLKTPSSYTAWANPAARIGVVTMSLLSAANGTARVLVASSHVEYCGGILNPPSTSQNAPIHVLSVDKSSVNPTTVTPGARVVATVSISVGQGSGGLDIAGVSFVQNLSAGNFNLCQGSNHNLIFRRCAFTWASVGGSAKIVLGASSATGNYFIFEDCTFTFTSPGQAFGSSTQHGAVVFRRCVFAVQSGVAPPNLFVSNIGPTLMESCDLTALAGTSLGWSTTGGSLTMRDCLLPASTTITAGGTPAYHYLVTRSGTDASSMESVQQVEATGNLAVETTVVRTGGASDGTPVSWKIQTSANACYAAPFECAPISIWNDATGSSKTVTVYGIWDAGVVPNDDEVWIDVAYLGTAGNPQASFATTRKANPLAANSALASDSSTWGGSTTKFKMQTSFTPQLKGPFTVYVRAAKPSTTFYVDPRPVVT